MVQGERKSVDPADERTKLLVALTEARKKYVEADTPEALREAWADQLRAVWMFVLKLDPPFNVLEPLTDLVGALGDLDRGTLPYSLKKTERRGAGKKPLGEIRHLAQGAAAIDVLLKDGVGLEDAARRVSRAMKSVGTLSENANYKTLLGFRRNLFEYGDEAVEIRKIAAETITSRSDLTFSDAAVRFIKDQRII